MTGDSAFVALDRLPRLRHLQVVAYCLPCELLVPTKDAAGLHALCTSQDLARGASSVTCIVHKLLNNNAACRPSWILCFNASSALPPCTSACLLL